MEKVTDHIVCHSVVEIAELVGASDLLDEYRQLTVRLSADGAFADIGDLATLCAVAIARVQFLERAMHGGTTRWGSDH